MKEAPANPAGEVQAIQSGQTVVWFVGQGQPQDRLEWLPDPIILGE